MSAKTLATLAIAALLLVPATLILASPRAAAEDVPQAPGVPWQPLVGFSQVMYLRYGDNPLPPDCSSGGFISSTPGVNDATSGSPRAQCVFATTTTTGTPTSAPTTAEFKYPTSFTRGFNISTGINVRIVGSFTAGQTFSVTITAGSTQLHASHVISADDQKAGNFGVLVGPDSGASRANFPLGAQLDVQISAQPAPLTGPAPLPIGSGTTWSLDDTRTQMLLITDDAYRAATWTGDANTSVLTTFRPVDNNTTAYPLLRGFFALQSAWGQDDINSLTVPTFRIFQGQELANPFPGAINTLVGQKAPALSSAANGIQAWGFPSNQLDYRGWRGGQYQLHTDIAYPNSNGIKSGIVADFAINSQGVRLTPFTDANVTPTMTETAAHTVLGGSTTTYLLTAKNIGSANDTFRVTTQFVPVPGSPQTGWGATISGPEVVGDTVQLSPGASKLITVTVTTPFASSGSGTFLVTATSINDAAIVSPSLTLVATLGTGTSREVGVIAPGREITVPPGKDTDVPIYVWNRATRTSNLTLDVATPDSNFWTVNIVANGGTLRHLNIPNVAPGAIALVTLRVHGPDQSQSLQHDYTLNATNADISGVAQDRVVRFKLTQVGGFKVDVLDKIPGFNATVETSRCADGATGTGSPAPGGVPATLPGTSSDCASQTTPPPDDGPDTVLLRTWITNTGRTRENVVVTLSALTSAQSSSPCSDKVFPSASDLASNPSNGKIKLVTRDGAGRMADFGGTLTDLAAGNTSELYVLLKIDRTQKICLDDDMGRDFVSFVVTAVGATTQQVGAYNAIVYAEDTGGVNGVQVQSVQRVAGSSGNPSSVITTDAARPTVTQPVKVGSYATYYVRLTNAASWSDYVDATGNGVNANVTLTPVNVDKEHGWNISMRPVNGDINNLTNPFGGSYRFSNVDTTVAAGMQRQAWRDVELEVRVYAPDGVNQTALAGEQDQITLIAARGAATSTLVLKTIVADFAQIEIVSSLRIATHAAETGAGLVYVYNNGSAPTSVTLTAAMDRDATSNPDAWRVEPSPLSFSIGAFRNKSIALSITPPGGATSGLLHISAVFAPDRNLPDVTRTISRDIPVDVVGSGSLALSAPIRFQTTAPGHSAVFSLNLTNTKSGTISYTVDATPLPNWTAVVPGPGTITSGQTVQLNYVLTAPGDVFNDTRYDSIVRVQGDDTQDDFAVVPVSVSISGGSAVPSVSAPVFQKTVDRQSNQTFELQVRNLGNAAGVFPITVTTTEPDWIATIQSLDGTNLTSIRAANGSGGLGPNELRTLRLNVVAPLAVQENKAVTFEVTVMSPEQTAVSKTTVRALIHDYGVAASLPTSSVDMIPGISQDYIIHVTNTGNDNDTLNVSTILPSTDFTDWVASVSPDHVFLGPGQSTDVHATLRVPTSPLPTPRAYSFQFYIGTVGGAAVNVSKNATISATANVLEFRALDVDGDGILEMAVDKDKTKSNGYEDFREISGDGYQCVVVSNSRLQGTARFFLDCTSDTKTLDGVADVWFDPDSVYAYKITLTPDINNDGTPEYLLDTDRDGKIDRAYDTITERYWAVTEIHALGDTTTTQYVVDNNADGRPDYYVDVAGKISTKTLDVSGHPELVGLDTKNVGKADKYYDPQTQAVTGATASNLTDFVKNNWYFILAFVALVVLTVILIVVRARRNKREP